ncbi:MAG: MAPEG family protein [Pseudomonadota bacterium]
MEQYQIALSAVGIYAAICFFILTWMGNAIGALRRKHRIAIGHGDNKHLERTMRGQANAVENMPVFLIGLLIAALMGAPAWMIHVLGLVFSVGRIVHAYHFVQEDAPIRLRFVGFAISFFAMVLLFIGLAGTGIWAIFTG